MEKLSFTVSCKDQKDYENKSMIMAFYEGLPEKKQNKFIEFIESLKLLLKK